MEESRIKIVKEEKTMMEKQIKAGKREKRENMRRNKMEEIELNISK